MNSPEMLTTSVDSVSIRPFVAVDWGTTSFRLWSLSSQGEVVERSNGPFGMSGLKKSDFAKVLDENLVKLGIPADTPVVICGMAGAAQGWIEVPYMSTSEDVFSIGRHAVRVPEEIREVYILPGVMQLEPSNVMRGEETQILGLLATQPDFKGTVCMPGTHTKWVQIHNGCIDSFSTCMTGELFALLSEHSVLKHSMASSGWDEIAFEKALLDVMDSPTRLAERLFGIRAATLLDDQSSETARARLSGMLIGLELAAMRLFWAAGNIAIIGEPSLCQTYSAALDLQHAESHSLDAEAMTLRGLITAYKKIEKKLHGA